MKKRIYLDYNATAPLLPEAFEALKAVYALPLNASSPHEEGRKGRAILDKARDEIATLCGASATMVVFNSGATEGNNTVLHHFQNERILVSAIEHPSVLEYAKTCPDHAIIPVTSDGMIDCEALENLLKAQKTALVSVMAVNNETGVIQPIEKISLLAHKYGALFHCDGVQAAGRIPLDMTAQGIDFLTLSAHKIGGPQGVGALAFGLCGITPTLLFGGGQEKKARPGTENVAGIAGFGAAAQYAREALPNKNETQRHQTEKRLRHICPHIIIHGQSAPRVYNTISFSLPGLLAETLLMAFDLEGISLSNGSACSSGRVEPSSVLKAMSIDSITAKSTLRLSWGWDTKEEDIEEFLIAFEKIVSRMNRKIESTAQNHG